MNRVTSLLPFLFTVLFAMPAFSEYSLLSGGSGASSKSSSSSSASSPSQLSDLNMDDTKSKILIKQTIYVVESDYYLGAGDVLTAFIWSGEEQKLSVTVTNDGTIIVPTVGAFNYPNSPLSSVKDSLSIEIKKRYRAKRIDLFLSEIKKVKVQILGEVGSPATYEVSGATRILALGKEAGGILESGDIRNIVVSNDLLGDTTIIDALAALRSSDSKTPYVKTGDMVFVKKRSKIVRVSGAVEISGVYDYSEGDNVGDIIKIAGGLTKEVDSNRVIITRLIDNYDSIADTVLTVNEAQNYQLDPDDRILVSKIDEYRLLREVKVSGEVAFPGYYPIRKNKTLLIDLINAAGGLTDDAFLRGSRILRSNYTDAGVSEYQRLSKISYIELSPEEKSYLKYRSTDGGKPKISIDFKKVLNGADGVSQIILRDGDEIIVAKRDLSINIMGAVTKPGLIPFKEGASIDYYLNRAGGFKKSAEKRDVKVVKGGTEIWLEAGEVDEIELGDAIWVPDEQYVDGLKKTSQILGIIGGIAGVIVAGIAVASFAIDNKESF
jgi:protein involved in polysaccharide export with SLBB domain